MIPLAQPLPCQALLEQVVTKAFSQRRKVIRNCVAGLFSEDELRQAGVDPQDRPEAVPVQQFVAWPTCWRHARPDSPWFAPLDGAALHFYRRLAHP
jgi:16S rRNA (adenine1518-N6/adenine1519-N6)-dimethyltransferase